MKILLLIILFCTTSWSDVYYYEYGKKVQLTALKEQRVLNDTNITYYQNEAGQKVGVTRELITKCKDGKSCQEVFKKYNLNNISHLTSKILLITLQKGDDPFDLSQKLSLEDDIVFAHPNFIKKWQKR